MKRSTLILATGLFISTTVFTSCNSSAQKVENAKENVIEAAADLNKANEDYISDMNNYRVVANEKITANDNSIILFKKRMEDQKQEAKAEYNKKIEALEKKNTDIKKKLSDYKADGQASWDLFKTEFTREIKELDEAISSLTAGDKK
jgi:uncharacterized protein YaaN involved in tellurite resistance